jgi:hypothetical protein
MVLLQRLINACAAEDRRKAEHAGLRRRGDEHAAQPRGGVKFVERGMTQQLMLRPWYP